MLTAIPWMATKKRKKDKTEKQKDMRRELKWPTNKY